MAVKKHKKETVPSKKELLGKDKAIDMISTFSMRMLKTGYCHWRKVLDSRSIEQWSHHYDKYEKEEIIVVIQLAYTTMRRFMEHMENNPEDITEVMCLGFIRDAEVLQQELEKYIKDKSPKINVELWIHEFLRSLSKAVEFFESRLEHF